MCRALASMNQLPFVASGVLPETVRRTLSGRQNWYEGAGIGPAYWLYADERGSIVATSYGNGYFAGPFQTS
jgi:hypothetical protein